MDIENTAKVLTRKDPELGKIISKLGIIKLQTPPRAHFESLINSIVSQQLSTKAAATIHKRFLQALENDISPHHILNTDLEVFRQAGLSRQKTKYMLALAEAFTEDAASFDHIHELPDDEVVKLLTRIKGIGVWTAHMFMMFNLLREDIFPIGDLGIRRSMEKYFFKSEKQEHKVLVERAEIWAPNRTVASFYLWDAIDS